MGGCDAARKRGTGMSDLSWVKRISVVDAIDKTPVKAMMDNPGWHLLHVGLGEGGQTTLTFGWGNKPEMIESEEQE